MTILITGGAGFIGSNFIRCFMNAHPDTRVICLDSLTYAGNIATLREFLGKRNFKFVYGDICDRDLVFRLFQKETPDIVVNFAAESHVDRSIDDPGIFLKTNIIGTSILLDACRKYGVSHFHQISTDEVYGSSPSDDTASFFTENAPLNPSSPYSCSKASADLLVLSYYHTYSLPISISRSSNNYGPSQFPEKLIPLTILNILRNKPIPLYGNGLNVRDWLSVNDHCEAIDLILQYGKTGEIYNIASHEEIRNIDLVKMICSILGGEKGQICYVKDRPGHDFRYGMDTKKIEALGWKRKTELKRGIKETVQWYLDHEDWWRSIMSGEYVHWNELNRNEFKF